MVQTRLHKHSLSKKEQAVSSVAFRASFRDPIDEFQDVYGSRAASAAFRQQLGSDFSRSGYIQPVIQAKPSFRGLSHALVPIQAKLSVGQANDRYEQEADRVASQVVQQINAPATNQPTKGDSVQLKEAEEKKGIQAKLEITSLQGKKAIAGEEASTNLESAINSSRGRGIALDAGLQRSMGQAMGADFSCVRVHTGGDAVQMNKELGAQAFTYGSDIYFREGKAPGNNELTAHELTHVVQQAGVIPADTSAKTQSSMPFLSENSQIARQSEESGEASSTTSTPPSTVPSTIKVWIHSFIPMAQVSDPFGYCYSGDNRRFSNAIHASYRTHQEIEFDISTGSPTINYKDTGTSHQLNSTTGAVEKTAKAPVSQLTNGSVNRSGSSYRMNFQADAKNPLAWYACNINLNLTLSVNPSARTCSIQGTHDGFPAYEVYVTANGGAGATVYTYDPSSTGAGPESLCGGNEQTASGTVSF